jgi:hypothetical protein
MRSIEISVTHSSLARIRRKRRSLYRSCSSGVSFVAVPKFRGLTAVFIASGDWSVCTCSSPRCSRSRFDCIVGEVGTALVWAGERMVDPSMRKLMSPHRKVSPSPTWQLETRLPL